MRLAGMLLLLLLNSAPSLLALRYSDLRALRKILELGHCDRSVNGKLRITPERYARALGFLRNYASVLSHLFDKNDAIDCTGGMPQNSSCKCFQGFAGAKCDKYNGNCAVFECTSTSCGYTLETAIESVKCVCNRSRKSCSRSQEDFGLQKDGVSAQENEISKLRYSQTLNTPEEHLEQYNSSKKKKVALNKIRKHLLSQLSLDVLRKILKNRDYKVPINFLDQNPKHASKFLPRSQIPDEFSSQVVAKRLNSRHGLPVKFETYQKLAATSSKDPDTITPINDAFTLAPLAGVKKLEEKNSHFENILKRQDKLYKIFPALKEFLGSLQSERIASRLDNTLPESYEEMLSEFPNKITIFPFAKPSSTAAALKITTESTFITLDIREGMLEDQAAALPKLISAQALGVTKPPSKLAAGTGDVKVTVLSQEFSRAELLLGAFITTTVSSEKKLKWPSDIETLFRGNGSCSTVVLPNGVKLLASHENVLAKLIPPMKYSEEDIKGRKYLSNQKTNKEEAFKRHDLAIFRSKASEGRNHFLEAPGEDQDQPLMG